MKILFVDDDVKRNMPFVRYVEVVEGWDILWEKKPSGALARLASECSTIDFVLLDIMMPPDDSIDRNKSEMGKSTGILLIKKINEISEGKIPIVILSARQDLQSLVNKDNVVAYLQKPNPPEEVVETFKKFYKDTK
jgi:CheY-like chemotaxis protein